MTKRKADGKGSAIGGEDPLPLLSFQGACNTWDCDDYGHMNVRYYINRAFQGWAPFAAAIGLPHAFQKDAVSTLRPRDIHVRFHRENRAGEHMNMRTGILSVTDDTVTLYQEARKNFSDGELSATFVTVLEHVEAKRGRPFAWTKKARESFAGLTIPALPEFGAPRSVMLNPPSSDASLTRAVELNVPVNGLSVLQAHECDVFGRMLPEILMGRHSDGAAMMIKRALRTQSPAPLIVEGREIKFGIAMVECRLHFNTWPTVGDMLQVHSGIVESKPKTMRFANWTLDPVTGERWGGLEAVVAHFDLEQRRSTPRSDEFLALADRQVLKGFKL